MNSRKSISKNSLQAIWYNIGVKTATEFSIISSAIWIVGKYFVLVRM